MQPGKFNKLLHGPLHFHLHEKDNLALVCTLLFLQNLTTGYLIICPPKSPRAKASLRAMIRSEGEYVERLFSIIPEILREAGAADWGLGFNLTPYPLSPKANP
jgi:hypothetical protein